MLFKYLENVYIFKTNNWLNFVGGTSISAHFDVPLKCQKGFLAIFLKT